jgi:Protein of unknown function (DUF1761)
MELNYFAILVCAILSMVLGGIWYGPLFGRTWATLIGSDPNDLEAMKEVQKKAAPLYLVQFLLTLFQVYVLAHFINGWKEASGLETSLWIYVAFVVPIIAGSVMWNNYTKQEAWTRFGIQAGYQLVLFVVFGFVLGVWGV